MPEGYVPPGTLVMIVWPAGRKQLEAEMAGYKKVSAAIHTILRTA